MSDSISAISPSSSSVKSQELLVAFEAICDRLGIKVQIDPPSFTINSPAAIDVEHDEQGNLVGIGVYDGNAYLYFTTVSRMLSDKLLNLSLIAHNGKGDFDCLRSWGIPVLDDNLVWDSMLIGHIIDSSQMGYGLKDMAKRELGIEYPDYDEIVGKHKGKTKLAPKCPRLQSDCCGRVTLDKQPIGIVSKYNALDCYCTWKLYEKQRDSILQ